MARERPAKGRFVEAEEIHSIPTMQCRAILFDLDGVLVASRECIELIWHAWAAERGLEAADFLRVAHERRIAETLGLVAPQVEAAAEARALVAGGEGETRGVRAA